MRIVRVIGIISALALVPACGDDDGGGGTPDSGGGNVDAPGGDQPSVSATAGADPVDCGGTVTLTVTVQNFTLEEPTGQANADGHGHYHVYLDNATGADYLAVDFGGTVDVEIPHEATPGAHTLHVTLQNNDHSPLDPAVEDTVDITVSDNPCLEASLSDSSVPPGTTVTITVEAYNFTLEDPTGQPDADGHGHYHVYFDDATGADYMAVAFEDTVDVTIDDTATAGAHSLRIQLQNNNHTPLNPDVSTVLDLTVE